MNATKERVKPNPGTLPPELEAKAALVEAFEETTSAEGKRWAAVEFVDCLLAEAWKHGGLRVSPLDKRTWRLELTPPSVDLEVPHGAAAAKLRSVCANLSVRCNETAGVDGASEEAMNIYGGSGVLQDAAGRRFKVATMNTMSEQWFKIEPLLPGKDGADG